jgi:acyl-ACP thioesterase
MQDCNQRFGDWPAFIRFSIEKAYKGYRMGPDFQLTEDTHVKSYETDFQRTWKPSAMVQNLLEAATLHAARLGYGFDGLIARDMIFVLSRLKVKFVRFPAMSQAVTITTWPKGIQQKLFFMRDFEVCSAEGETLAVATSAWLLIDPTTRRMLPPRVLTIPVPDNHGFSALDEPLEKIMPPDEAPVVIKRTAAYSAVDMLGHANAARYVEWICDCFSPDDYRSRQMAWLQINYNHETRPGETLSLRAAPEGQDTARFYLAGDNQNTGLRAFDAEVGWLPKTDPAG